MWAIVIKEFRQLRRDRRPLAMLFMLPFLFLIVFGYAARTVVALVMPTTSGAAPQVLIHGTERFAADTAVPATFEETFVSLSSPHANPGHAPQTSVPDTGSHS
jgi:ABC-2 type transport system permease protein